METAAVAFGSAILGALASFVGLVFIDNRRLAHARTGMLRALMAELQQNSAAVMSLRQTGFLRVVDFSDVVWRAVQCDLAQFLEHRLYEDLAFVYLSISSIQRMIDKIADPEMATDPTWRAVVETVFNKMNDVRGRLLNTPQLREFKPSFQADWQKTADYIAAQAAANAEAEDQ